MTMVHTFCTLKEAAETLHVSEEQVEAILQNGILREFREGSYRLLKAAEVDALAAANGPSQNPDCGAEIDTFLDPPSQMRLPHCAAVTIQPPQRGVPRPRNTERVRQQAAPASGQAHARVNTYYANAGAYQHKRKKSTQQTKPPVHGQAQSLSVREWLWSGLTQDRPVAIAILFGLVLTILAALAAGVCLLAEGL